MAKTILDGSRISVGVGLEAVGENSTTAVTLTAANAEDATRVGGLGLGCATGVTLYTIPLVESATLDVFQKDTEEFQTIDDNYIKRREIRDNGSVSITFVAFDDADTGDLTTVDAFNWEYAHLNFPYGLSDVSAGHAGTYSVLDDTVASSGHDYDITGYCVEIEVKDDVGTGKMLYILHNCRMSLSCETGYQKAQRYTVKFEDARTIEITNAAKASPWVHLHSYS